MKSIKVLLCLCALVVFSCETEDANLQEEELINVDLTARTTTPPPGWEDWNTGDFGWYLKRVVDKIASTISEDPLAASEFQTIVQNNAIGNAISTDVIVPLGDIFSDSSSYLYQAIQTSHDPCDSKPEGAWGRPHPPLGNHTATTYATFINNLINEHCLELYLPFGFTSSSAVSGDPTPIICLPHPLAHTNTIRSIEARKFPQNICGNYITINQAEHYENLMILRPNPGFTVNPNGYCEYPIYDNIDFTEFFEQ